MKQIPLSRGKISLVDDTDHHWLSKFNWYAHHNHKLNWYAVRTIRENGKRRTIGMHRMILGISGNQKTDHINGDGLDNRRCNLRVCTQTQNTRNQKLSRRNSSGYKGVKYNESAILHPWQARITFNGRVLHLGVFTTAVEAAKCYDCAAIHYHGEFARTNAMLGLL